VRGGSSHGVICSSRNFPPSLQNFSPHPLGTLHLRSTFLLQRSTPVQNFAKSLHSKNRLGSSICLLWLVLRHRIARMTFAPSTFTSQVCPSLLLPIR